VRPFVKPVTVIGEETPPANRDAPPLLDVHVALYMEMADPPSEAGGVNVTVIRALPPCTDTTLGAPASVLGTAGADAVDAAPGPLTFVAVTVQV
jgi:hypothetical protein